jgi:RNA-directed DNA polymerase
MLAAMLKDAPANAGAPDPAFAGSWSRVSEMQAKLHRWAAADPGRRFGDLFNLVHDPATLKVAWDRVAGNTGARSAGVDGRTAVGVEQDLGVQEFLDDLRSAVRAGTFRPMPVRERMIPKPGGGRKMRRLGIPTVADRVVQAALKLVLEPIFEAGFLPVSYGFRPRRRAHDAIAEIHLFGTQGYQWVLDADIEACLDASSHCSFCWLWWSEQPVLRGWWFDTQAFPASGADVDGAEPPVLDTLHDGLAGDAVGEGGFQHG